MGDMKPDTFTNTPEDAAAYEQLRGRNDDDHTPGGFTTTRTPYCSVCQRGTKAYVCGPCQRVADQLARERNNEWWAEPADSEDSA